MFERVYSGYVYLQVAPTGDALDRPEEPEVDKIDTYQSVISALQEARNVLYEMTDSQGRTIDRKRATKCFLIADRCTRALDGLQKVAEL